MTSTWTRGQAARTLGVSVTLLLAAALAFGGGAGEKPAAAAGAKPQSLEISIGMTCPDMNADEMGRWIQEKFSMTIRIVNTDGDKLKLLATAGNLPDAFGVNLGDAFFNQLKVDNLIRDIPDAAIDRYPYVKRYLGVTKRSRHSGRSPASTTPSTGVRRGQPAQGSSDAVPLPGGLAQEAEPCGSQDRA